MDLCPIARADTIPATHLALMLVVRDGERSLTELQKVLGIPQSTASLLVRRVAEREFVVVHRRSKQGKRGGPEVFVSLSPKGARMFRRARGAVEIHDPL